jgi:DNA-binding NarL/FixJ family response regulator
MEQPIRVVIADDHELLRSGFHVLLRKQTEIEIVGEAENGSDLLEKIKEKQPDVVITDIQMPGMDGIAATRQITSLYPQIGVIALTMFNEDNLIIDMLEAGAKGYLLKNTNKAELIDAVKAIYNGGTYFCTSTSGKLAKLIGRSKFDPYRNSPKLKLSEREIEIMQLICQELQNKEIAERLNISVRTVEGIREKLLEKINAKNIAGVAIYAIKHGYYKT